MKCCFFFSWLMFWSRMLIGFMWSGGSWFAVITLHKSPNRFELPHTNLTVSSDTHTHTHTHTHSSLCLRTLFLWFILSWSFLIFPIQYGFLLHIFTFYLSFSLCTPSSSSSCLCVSHFYSGFHCRGKCIKQWCNGFCGNSRVALW